jgi:hypothetical protein
MVKQLVKGRTLILKPQITQIRRYKEVITIPRLI